jgi:predicted TIM-barrel fold metal-dependent hydrolase
VSSKSGTYVGNRRVQDADAHVMESADWLIRHADGPLRDRMPKLDLGRLQKEAEAALEAARRGEQRELEAAQIIRQKNWSALGTCDPGQRSRALDYLGFCSQLVFPTYAHHELISLPGERRVPPELLYAMVDAHNRGMAAFCADDPRLLAAGFVALDVPERAVASARIALDLGCAGIEIPSCPVGPYSLTHPAYYPLYELLEERRRPLLFHVGGGGKLVNPVFAANGGGAAGESSENPGLTYIGIPAPLEMAIAALVLDGVFERFPRLMCGAVEQGASWLPGFMRRVDAASHQFAQPAQRSILSMAPSDYVVRQLRVTPFPFEDIAWIIEETHANILMFGSDYPHDEGGEDPLAAFDLALQHYGDGERERILCTNFEELMGEGLPAEVRRQRPLDRERKDDLRRRTGRSPNVVRQQALLRLLICEVAQQKSICATREEIQHAIDEFRLDNGLADLDRMLEWMSRSGVEEPMLVQILEADLLSYKIAHVFGGRFDRAIEDQAVFLEACRRTRTTL